MVGCLTGQRLADCGACSCRSMLCISSKPHSCCLLVHMSEQVALPLPLLLWAQRDGLTPPLVTSLLLLLQQQLLLAILN